MAEVLALFEGKGQGASLSAASNTAYGLLNAVTEYVDHGRLSARLNYYQAVSGDRLSCMALELRIRGKSTRQSHGTAIYYVDLNIRENMVLEDVITDAIQKDQLRRQNGYHQASLDQAARAGFCKGAFQFDEEDIQQSPEEFYPESQSPNSDEKLLSVPVREPVKSKPSLLDKLERKAN